MNKLLKGLEINGKDNEMTAIAKGLTEGVIQSGITILTIAGVLYAFGKAKQEVETEKQETEELESIDTFITQDKDMDWENI